MHQFQTGAFLSFSSSRTANRQVYILLLKMSRRQARDDTMVYQGSGRLLRAKEVLQQTRHGRRPITLMDRQQSVRLCLALFPKLNLYSPHPHCNSISTICLSLTFHREIPARYVLCPRSKEHGTGQSHLHVDNASKLSYLLQTRTRSIT